MTDSLFTRNEPVAAIRGVHLDLKGLPPTPERLIELLKVFAAARYNAILVEWEDMFPWRVDAGFSNPTAYSDETVRRFAAAAKDHGLELIPLVQCLGHMETVLATPGYEKYRAVADRHDVINPMADGAADLIRRMIDDVLALMPDVRYFHLGGDEAPIMAAAPQAKAFMEAHGKGALYLKHVDPLLEHLNGRNIRPILWHDMMIHWEDQALDDLKSKADLMVWGYQGHPDTTPHHFNTKHIQRFTDHGLRLWGATAYKGSEGADADLGTPSQRQENALAWMDIARRYTLEGMVATGWSRYSTHRVQCLPIDSSLDCLLLVGAILHDGEPPSGGIAACVEALGPIGERQRFQRCYDAIRAFRDCRLGAWAIVRHWRQQQALAQIDPRRKCAWIDEELQRKLREDIENLRRTSEAVRRAFDGLVDPIWINEYVDERIVSLEIALHHRPL